MFVEEKAPGEVHRSRESSEGLQEWAKQLLSAAALLEKPGEWGQGFAHIYEGAVAGNNCLLTAVWMHVNYDEAEKRLIAHFGSRRAIFVWNDKPGRTAAEVVAKLRAVALGG